MEDWKKYDGRRPEPPYGPEAGKFCQDCASKAAELAWEHRGKFVSDESCRAFIDALKF